MKSRQRHREGSVVPPNECQALWKSLVEQSVDGIVVLNENGRVFKANRTFADMLGYTADEISHMYVWDWDTKLAKEDGMWMGRKHASKRQHFETKHQRKDGSVIDVELSSSTAIHNGRELVFCVCRDVTRRKRSEYETYLLATTDILTGLSNRRAFLKHMALELDRANRYGTPFSLLMYDFDRFKRINDEFGHQHGDRVLQGSAEIVRANIRSIDVPVRWGGDEFMVMLPQSQRKDACRLAEKLLQMISNRCDRLPFAITASFGVIAYKDGDTQETIISRVDHALYTAKAKGGNCVASA